MHYRIELWVKNYTLKEYSLKCLNGEKISDADSLFFFFTACELGKSSLKSDTKRINTYLINFALLKRNTVVVLNEILRQTSLHEIICFVGYIA